jgi:hypothetical protein
MPFSSDGGLEMLAQEARRRNADPREIRGPLPPSAAAMAGSTANATCLAHLQDPGDAMATGSDPARPSMMTGGDRS